MSSAGSVGIGDALFAADDAACWEIRAGQNFYYVLESAVWVFDEQQSCFTYLSDIVGWDIGGHSDGDTGRAID